ncbi:GEVED domain-containing protein [Streptomyces sp. KL116D]|uniref:DUF7927 domain-containing protein n=1 Tax=Streptomyces sp. KL116D TaxID=3045152 RepID=UPI003555E140
MDSSRRTAAVVLSAALALSGALPATAAPHSHGIERARASAPGVPKDPVPVFTEDFEQTAAPVRLTGYTGAGPLADTYTADAAWLDNCNGWVVDNSAASADFRPGITDCGGQAKWWDSSRSLAEALGTFNGVADPEHNQAVTAFTAADPGANKVEFETSRPIALASPNRFITFSVDSAAMNCFAVGPSLKFFLMDGATAIPASDRGINPCTDPDARTVGSTKVVNRAADTPILFGGDTLGVRMVNAQGSGSGNDAAFDDIRVLDVTPSVDKAFGPAVAPAGGTSTLTFTVTNTSDLYAKPGWSFTDELPAGLTVADPAATSTTCTNGAVDADPGGTAVRLRGDLRAGQTSCTLSVDVTAGRGTYSNCAENVTDLVGVNPPGCASVEFQDPRYTITKTSSPAAGEPIVPGQKVDYTVTVTNPGDVPVDAAVTDDLTKVLDDATYDGDATAGAGTVNYTEPELSWSHTLAPGASATLTYSVTVHDPPDGDGLLTNAVTGTGRSNCADGTEPGCTTTVGVAGLDIRKTSDATGAVKPGDKVTYTVTVANTGKGAYKGATFTDDLTGVLDDATYGADAKATSGTVSYTAPEVGWTGDVPAGGTVTVTYSVTAFTDPAAFGDRTLGNAVVSDSPGTDCPAGSADPKCSTTHDVPTLTLAKTTDTSRPLPGDTVTYTVTLTNDSATAPYEDAAFTDDLTKVLDDATYDGDATADSGTVAYTSPRLSWRGDVPAAGTVTLTYSVTVGDPPPGDKLLTNAVSGDVPGTNCPEGSKDPACTTTTPLPSLKIRKTATPDDPRPGDTITYTVTVTDDGEAAYPGATFTDDLTDVLDDAAYNEDAAATTGAVAYTAPRLTWTGDLATGASATVTYTVAVGPPGAGDGEFINGVVGGPGSNCPPGSADPDCRTVLPAPDYDFGDAPDSYRTTLAENGPRHEIVDGLRLGGAVEEDTNGAPHGDADGDRDEEAVTARVLYTHDDTASAAVTVVNTTGRDAVLAGWLDRDQNGTFDRTELVTATVPDGGTGATLTWTGLRDIKPGRTFLRLRLYGDSSLERAPRAPVAAPSPTGFGGPGEVEDHLVAVEAAHLVIAKSASASAPGPGDRVTYTVTVTSSAPEEYAGASFTDDLTKVLDDAAYEGDARATTGTVTYREPRLSWQGTVPAGGTVHVTYSVTVHDPVRGDRVLTNAVTGPEGSNCAAGSAGPGCSTTADVPPPAAARPPAGPKPPAPPAAPGRPHAQLPDTGAPGGGLRWGLSAAMLVAVGALLVIVSRRPRSGPNESTM